MDLSATSLLSRWSASALFKFIHGKSKLKDRRGPKANVKLVKSQALSAESYVVNILAQIGPYRLNIVQIAQSPRRHDARSFLLCPIAVILQITQLAGHPIDMG